MKLNIISRGLAVLRRASGTLVIAALLLAGIAGAVLPPSGGGGGGSGTIMGEVATGPMTWTASNFPAFWHENGLSGEIFAVLQPDLGSSQRMINEHNLVYNTTRQIVPYKVFTEVHLGVMYALNEDGSKTITGGGYYAKIGWLGKPYAAVNGNARKLSEIVLEQNSTESRTLFINDTWNMGEGYGLKLNSIDSSADPWQAWLEFSNTSGKLDDKVIKEGEVYTYVAGSLAGESQVPVFVTYVDNLTIDSIRLKYSWLISENVTGINTGDTYGKLRVTGSSSNMFELKNMNSITLTRGATINLLDSLYLVVNDSSSLAYYPVMTDQIPAPTQNISIESSTGKGTVYFETDSGTIEDLVAVNVSEIPQPPPEGVDLYYGLFRFNITNISTGGSSNLTLTFPELLPENTTYWKFGANLTNSIPHWYAIPASINSNQLTFRITDGGMGDDDLTANGRIRDDSGPSLPEVILPVHNLDTGEDFGTIQTAINDPDTLNGHTIAVDPGMYREEVNVNKRLTIMSTSGNPANTIVQAYGRSVFSIDADYVTISGFTVKGELRTYGIYLNRANNSNISNNNITNSRYIIYSYYSSNNNFTGNNFYDNYGWIRLYFSHNNIIKNNNFTHNGMAIFSFFSSNNDFIGNIIENNLQGINLNSGHGNNINNNIIKKGHPGIYVYFHASNNNITGNNIDNISYRAIDINHYSSNNKIKDNNITNSNYGIYMNYNCNNNEFSSNIIKDNKFGIYMSRVYSNTIFNNYFNNTNNAYADSPNTWQIEKTPGTNIIGGPYLGGNYWSDYEGVDINGDGLGDTLLPYNSIGGIQDEGDYLPLTEPGARPECSDGVDNDGDGKTDYPADPGCSGPNDPDEIDEIIPVPEYPLAALPVLSVLGLIFLLLRRVNK